MRANGVYADTESPIADGIYGVKFIPIFSVAWDSLCKLNNSSMANTCELFQDRGTDTSDRFPAQVRKAASGRLYASSIFPNRYLRGIHMHR